MTDSRVDTAVLTGAQKLTNPHGTTVLVTESGAVERLEVDDCSILLYPASALADGLGGLWLRVRNAEATTAVSLVGQTTPTTPTVHARTAADRTGRWDGLDLDVSLRLSDRQAAWFWHVRVTNRGADDVEVDLVFAQDAALAPLGAVRTNEYYLSQYLDLTPVDVPGHGTALGVRQNMPGPTPWLLVGCLGTANRWATDARQLTGRGRVEGSPWPGLAADLPATRVQGEHTVAVLQTDPVVLGPGDAMTSGFYGLHVTDHPAATSAADLEHAYAALDDPAAVPPEPAEPTEPAESPAGAEGKESADEGAHQPPTDHRSLFGTAAPLACRPLSSDELDRLAGTDRVEPEHDGDDLLAFFTTDGSHVVTAAKQGRVLRPHGHLLRSGSTLLPDEPSVCATVWMDGTFCSQLTQGHVSLGAITSVRRSYLGLAPAHGTRLFVRTAPTADGATADWTLLGTPSAWQLALDECRWWYAHEGGLIQVTTRVAADDDAVRIGVRVIDGPAVDFLAATHLPWLDLDEAPGTVRAGGDGVDVAPPADSHTTALFPGGYVHLGWTEHGGAAVGDDAALFRDGRSRGLAWVTVRTSAQTEWELTLTPRLVPVAPDRPTTPDFWATTAGAVELSAPDSDAGRELGRIATIVPWFTHDALVHYLSPRGLEQYTGGAWGTRDVSQGPVGLLLTLGAHTELRRLVMLIMTAQNQRGDWPQAFDFLERHRSGGQAGSHGDVVYWPLLALADYLAATGDHTVLAESLTFAGDDGPTRPSPLAEHVRAALDHIESTLINQTSLPAYGHGDWNDSLQPADPDLAARMCSSWTVVLQAHALGSLGAELSRHEDTRALGERALRIAEGGVADLRRLLLVDGVLAGYGLFPIDADDVPEIEPLIHPRDERTGLTYSILAMIHAIAGDLFTPAETDQHLKLITGHLLGPDGARLFDRPVGYAGGPMTLFQRAEASTFFGREIGIMYMHAHLRYAEALARVGNGPALLRALALAQPVGVTDRIGSARPRQSTCYYSSSDAAFPDRYAASKEYADVFDGSVPLEGGWRVYSSGPGLFLQLLVQRLLGIRVRADRVEIDPVLDPGLDGVRVRLPVLGLRPSLRFTVGERGHGVASVAVNGAELPIRALVNPYREGGVSVASQDLAQALGGTKRDPLVEIRTR